MKHPQDEKFVAMTETERGHFALTENGRLFERIKVDSTNETDRDFMWIERKGPSRG